VPGALADAWCTVEPEPVFGYGIAEDGATLEDNGPPADGRAWDNLLFELGAAAYEATLVVSRWHDIADSDRGSTIDAIRTRLAPRILPLVSEISGQSAG